jgi:hypothetical protein
MQVRFGSSPVSRPLQVEVWQAFEHAKQTRCSLPVGRTDHAARHAPEPLLVQEGQDLIQFSSAATMIYEIVSLYLKLDLHALTYAKIPPS